MDLVSILAGHRGLPRRPDSSIPRTSISHRESSSAPSWMDDSPSFVPVAPPPPQGDVQWTQVYYDRVSASLQVWELLMEPGGHRHFQYDPNPQAMPGNIIYQYQTSAQQRVGHNAPPPARGGFTRSPMEEDIVICPSCAEELVHRKHAEIPSKSPSKRAEHPFWVVRNCGHVYCNSCFQNRSTPFESFTHVTFPEITGWGTKVLGCVVEGCQSEVNSEENWVGVFL